MANWFTRAANKMVDAWDDTTHKINVALNGEGSAKELDIARQELVTGHPLNAVKHTLKSTGAAMEYAGKFVAGGGDATFDRAALVKGAAEGSALAKTRSEQKRENLSEEERTRQYDQNEAAARLSMMDGRGHGPMPREDEAKKLDADGDGKIAESEISAPLKRIGLRGKMHDDAVASTIAALKGTRYEVKDVSAQSQTPTHTPNQRYRRSAGKRQIVGMLPISEAG